MLVFADGFDYYTNLSKKYLTVYTNAALLPTGGRRGGGCGVSNINGNYLVRFYPGNLSTFIMGMAIKGVTPGSNYPMLSLMSVAGDTYPEIKVYVNTDGSISVQVQISNSGYSTPIITAPNLVLPATWHYFEIKAQIRDSASGYIEIRLDNQTVGSWTGDTLHSGNPYVCDVLIGSVTINNADSYRAGYFDDIYICDGTGDVNNDFLGDVCVTPYYPRANGDVVQFTPSSGSNYDIANNNPPNESVYNSSAVVGQRDLFLFDQVPSNIGVIAGVQMNVYSKRSTTALRRIVEVCKTGGVERDFATSLAETDAIYIKSFILEKDPSDDAVWTKTKLDAAQFGYKIAV